MKKWLLLVAISLALASPAQAAFVLIANGSCGSSDTNNCTTGSLNTTGADLCVVNIGSEDIGAVTVSDNKSNGNATGLTLQDSNLRDQLFYWANPTTGSGHTFTASSTAGLPSLQVACFSGSKLVSPFDQQNGVNTGTSPTAQPGSITPSENNELVVSGTSWNGSGTTATIDGSYAITNQVDKDANHRGGALAYWIQTTATATNPTWSYAGAGTSVRVTIASFKVAAATTVTPRGMLLGVGP